MFEEDLETGSIAFEYAGATYTMVLDMKAIHFFERTADLSIVEALGELQEASEQRKPPKVGVMAFLMQAGLRRHHPEVSAEKAFRMVSEPSVMAALGAVVRAASPPADDDASAEGNGPGPTRKRTKPSTSRGSSKGRSKQG
jgi:hypothetical protein